MSCGKGVSQTAGMIAEKMIAPGIAMTVREMSVGEFAVENEIKRQACALVAGDKGYMPLVEQLISDGMKINVIFWDQAARELKETCSNFISLNQHLEILKPRVRENRENMLQTA